MTLEETEKQNGFVYPKLFREIYWTGAMEWLTHEDFWIRDNADRIDGKQFMFEVNFDCELIQFSDMMECNQELQYWIDFRIQIDGNKAMLNPDYQITQFAHNGAGDMYCFLYEKGVDEPKIVLYTHDGGDIELYGKNFEEFLYGQIVNVLYESIVEDDGFYDFDGIDDERIQAHIRFLSERYQKRLLNEDIEELEREFWSDKAYDIEILKEVNDKEQ